MAFKNQDFGLGRKHKRGRSGSGPGLCVGEETQALGFRTRGLAGGKRLEALFPPAVKNHMKKLLILLPVFTTGHIYICRAYIY